MIQAARSLIKKALVDLTRTLKAKGVRLEAV